MVRRTRNLDVCACPRLNLVHSAAALANDQTNLRVRDLHVESGSSTASSSSGAATSGHLILAEQLINLALRRFARTRVAARDRARANSWVVGVRPRGDLDVCLRAALNALDCLTSSADDEADLVVRNRHRERMWATATTASTTSSWPSTELCLPFPHHSQNHFLCLIPRSRRATD